MTVSRAWYYDRSGRPISSAEEFGRFVVDEQYPRIAETTLWHGAWVSTVWLGIDHNFARRGPPVIFETMVFAGGMSDLDQKRYSTEAEARAGHVAMCRRWRWRMWTVWAAQGCGMVKLVGQLASRAWSWVKARVRRGA